MCLLHISRGGGGEGGGGGGRGGGRGWGEGEGGVCKRFAAGFFPAHTDVKLFFRPKLFLRNISHVRLLLISKPYFFKLFGFVVFFGAIQWIYL